MKLVKINDLKETSRYLRMITYGEPGSGKTYFGASAALDDLTAPVMILEYRSQIGSLRANKEYTKAIDEGRLIIISLDSYSDLSTFYGWFDRGFGSSKQLDQIMLDRGYEGLPKTVVVDSITELQRSEVMRRAGNQEGKFLVDVERPQIQHWGALLNQLTLLANLFFGLPIHIIFNGLESVDYGSAPVGEQPPIQGYRLALQGQAKRQFPAYAMTVMRLERAPKNSQGVFNIGYTSGYKAKTKEQTGFLPAKIPNPTIPQIVRWLRAEDD